MRTLLVAILHFSSLMSCDTTWTLPETISSLGVNSSFPKIAMDGNGNAIAAWLENGAIIAKSKPVQGTWSDASTLSSAGSSSVRLVMDPSGNATALWLENGVVMTANSPLNGSWSAASAISRSGASSPQIDVDGNGNLVAVWARNGNIESATKLFGGSWPALVDVIVSTQATSPHVAIGANGSVVTVWYGLVASTNIVYSATKTINGTWSSAETISTPGQNSGYPRIAINVSGNAIAGWFRWDVNGSAYSNVICQVATFVNGIWSSPINLSSPGVRIPADVRVGLDDSGNAIALWITSFDGSTYALQSVVQPMNGNWTFLVDLLLNNLAQCNLDFVHVSDGKYQIIFLDYNQNDVNLQIQTTSVHVDVINKNVWAPSSVLSMGGNNANPKVVSVLNGSTVYSAAVWVNYTGLNTVVQAVSGIETSLISPSDLSVTQSMVDYGVFKEYQNIFSWQASPNAVGYLIFRNGLFVTSVGSSTFQYIDHNQKQNQTVTYGVAAVSDDHDQTSIISVVFQSQ